MNQEVKKSGVLSCRRRAFTLTELLVVVIVLGILSAVAVPKFTRILETRKTTEAEDVMGAIRTEQEKRCALGKPYTANMSMVASAKGTDASSHYNYTLGSQGVTAASSKGYSLKMLSYKDGRVCCEGAYCASLNKDYPPCDSLTPMADECAAVVASCSGPSTQSCGCNGTGTQSRTCDASTGTWSGWSACSVDDCKSCSGASSQSCGCNNAGTQSRTCDPFTGTWSAWGSCSVAECAGCPASTKPAASQACGACGTQTRSVTCDATSGTWQTGDWSGCTGQGECAAGQTQSQSCPEGYTGNQTRTCSSSCTWGAWNESACTPVPQSGCDESTRPADIETSCGPCGKQTITYYCHEETGQWRSKSLGCVVPDGYSNQCTPGSTRTQSCAVGYVSGSREETCSSTCAWEWSECKAEETCPSGYTYNNTLGKCCKYTMQVKSQEVAVGYSSGCSQVDLKTISYPGLTRCSTANLQTLAANCPSQACTLAAGPVRAQFSLPGGGKIMVDGPACRNGRWVYIKDNKVVSDKLDTQTVIFNNAICQQSCVDPQ